MSMWYRARIEQLFARLWHWGLVRNIWRGGPNAGGGGGIEVRNFSQFSAISQFFAIFRNFSQISAIFRNFSAIFHTSRFSDCLPTLVQNKEKNFFFYYSIHSQMLHSHQNLA